MVLGCIFGAVAALMVDVAVIAAIDSIDDPLNEAVWRVRYTFWQPVVLSSLTLSAGIVGALYIASVRIINSILRELRKKV